MCKAGIAYYCTGIDTLSCLVMTNPWSHAHGDPDDYQPLFGYTDAPPQAIQDLLAQADPDPVEIGNNKLSNPHPQPVSRSETASTGLTYVTNMSSSSSNSESSGSSGSHSGPGTVETSNYSMLKPRSMLQSEPSSSEPNSVEDANPHSTPIPSSGPSLQLNLVGPNLGLDSIPSSSQIQSSSQHNWTSSANGSARRVADMEMPVPSFAQPRFRTSSTASATVGANPAYRGSGYGFNGYGYGEDGRRMSGAWDPLVEMGKREHPGLASTVRERSSMVFTHDRTASDVTGGPSGYDRRFAFSSQTSLPIDPRSNLPPGAGASMLRPGLQDTRRHSDFGVIDRDAHAARIATSRPFGPREQTVAADSENHIDSDKGKDEQRRTIAGQYSPPQVFLMAPTPSPMSPTTAPDARRPGVGPRPRPVSHLSNSSENIRTSDAGKDGREDGRTNAHPLSQAHVPAPAKRESVFYDSFGEMGVQIGKPKAKRKVRPAFGG